MRKYKNVFAPVLSRKSKQVSNVNFTPILTAYGFDKIDDIKKKVKTKNYAECRYVCIYILTKMDFKQTEISEFIDMDRSSVSAAVFRVKDWMSVYPSFKTEVKELEKKCKELTNEK